VTSLYHCPSSAGEWICCLSFGWFADLLVANKILEGATDTNAESAVFGEVHGHDFNDPTAAALLSKADIPGEYLIIAHAPFLTVIKIISS
jgi:hypothetical protein